MSIVDRRIFHNKTKLNLIQQNIFFHWNSARLVYTSIVVLIWDYNMERFGFLESYVHILGQFCEENSIWKKCCWCLGFCCGIFVINSAFGSLVVLGYRLRIRQREIKFIRIMNSVKKAWWTGVEDFNLVGWIAQQKTDDPSILFWKSLSLQTVQKKKKAKAKLISLSLTLCSS